MKRYIIVLSICIMAILSCSLRNTSYYHATFIPPFGYELEMGFHQPHGMKVEPTVSYTDDSAAVITERNKVTRIMQLAESKERTAQTTKAVTMRDSIKQANESKVHKQILSEKHVIIAIDDASTDIADSLFHKIELFGFDTREVSDFITKSGLAVRFYKLN